MLGRCHELGRGVAQSDPLAAQWYARAADKGLDWAQFNLANLVLRGRGAVPDAARAMALYRAAACQGHAKAMNMIGRLYEEGWAIPRDLRLAFHWYRCAAEGGDFRGQYNFGTLLIAFNRISEATVWLERAVSNGTQDFLSAISAAMLASEHHGVRTLGMLATARQAASPTVLQRGSWSDRAAVGRSRDTAAQAVDRWFNLAAGSRLPIRADRPTAQESPDPDLPQPALC